MFMLSSDMKSKFDTLSQDLKEAIIKKDQPVNSMQDLIKVLEDISKNPTGTAT